MLFNSFHFLIFFPVVTILYFVLPHRFRWFLLLLASVYFYMAFVPVYILILAFTIVIDYIAGIYIEKSQGKKRKVLLVISLISNIGVLAFFKYFNFINLNITEVLHALGTSNPIPFLSILLPIGLSFHTFQAMSYTIEVYRGKQPAERNFGIYALYVMFYPQLVAGPIERPQNLIHQFYEEHSFDYERVASGLRLMLWGLFKKAVIADRLAAVADKVFNNTHQFAGPGLVIGIVFFAFQIFCDFSGYSDMAIGAARVMGFRLMKNFDRPYSAKSISELWSRWHISLSTWFRDYLYISLGGSRVSIPRWYFNLFFVFLVSGLWHGANWTFVLWGALHGFYLVFGLLTKDIRAYFTRISGLFKLPGLQNALRILIVFSLTSFAWIFFRANSFADAMYVVSHLFAGWGSVVSVSGISNLLASLNVNREALIIAFLSVLILEVVQYLNAKKDGLSARIAALPIGLRWGLYYCAILAILFFGVFESRQFIYFQF